MICPDLAGSTIILGWAVSWYLMRVRINKKKNIDINDRHRHSSSFVETQQSIFTEKKDLFRKKRKKKKKKRIELVVSAHHLNSPTAMHKKGKPQLNPCKRVPAEQQNM